MHRRILSICLVMILLFSPLSAFAADLPVPERKGTAPAEGSWLDPQFDADPSSFENPPVPVRTVRIGLSFGASSAPEAAFRDPKGQGFRFGYYDETRAFHELGTTDQELVTLCPTWYNETGLMLLAGDNGALLCLTEEPVLAVESLSGETGYGEHRYAGGFECRRQPDDSMIVVNVLDLES